MLISRIRPPVNRAGSIWSALTAISLCSRELALISIVPPSGYLHYVFRLCRSLSIRIDGPSVDIISMSDAADPFEGSRKSSITSVRRLLASKKTCSGSELAWRFGIACRFFPAHLSKLCVWLALSATGIFYFVVISFLPGWLAPGSLRFGRGGP